MRITIFGASGLLGKALMHEWSGDTVTGLTSHAADIRDAKRVQQVVEERVRSGSCWPRLTPMWTDAKAIRSWLLQ
jgi:NAD dependent epimerase/dehydratase family enzyme